MEKLPSKDAKSSKKDRSSSRDTRQPLDKINCFSLDLKKMQKKQTILPSISTTRNNLIESIAWKLKAVKQKIKSQQQEMQYQQLLAKSQIQTPPHIPIHMNYSMPFQIPYQYPFHYPFGCMQHHNCHNCCNHNDNKPKKQKKNKKPKKKQPKPIKPKLKNWFRIAGYAIYFTIYIKHYSQKFTINRKQWFYDRYNKNQKGIIDKGAQEFQNRILQLDLYQMCCETKQNKQADGQTVANWQDYSKTALVPKGTLQNKLKGRYTVGQFIINFSQTFIQKVKQITFNQQFLAEYHELFSAGSMDMNFMIDNLYVPQQTPFLFIHPTKGYLRLGYQQQIQLLLMKLMIRMVIYNFLFSLNRLKVWNKKLQEKYRLQLSKREEVWQLGRILGVYLYMICKQLYFEGIKNLKHTSNFYQLSKKFGVRSAKGMEQQKIILNQQTQGQKQFELIKNIKDYQLIKNKILKNGKLMQHKQVLKQNIIDMLSNLYVVLKKYERQLYIYVRNMTIVENYLIFDGIKRIKQSKNKEQNNRLLKPNNSVINQQRYGKQWNKIYGDHSLSTDGNKKRYNVKFSSGPSQNPGDQNNYNRNFQTYSSATQQNPKNKQKPNLINEIDIGRSKQMKKQFVNYDTFNSKYDKTRQDRIQQKFKNFLFLQDQKPLQASQPKQFLK